MVLLQVQGVPDTDSMAYSLDRSRKKLPRTQWNEDTTLAALERNNFRGHHRDASLGSWSRHSRASTSRNSRHSRGSVSRRSDRSRASRGSGASASSSRKHSWGGRNTPVDTSNEAPTLQRRTLRAVPPAGARQVKKKGRSWICGLCVGVGLCVLSMAMVAVAFSTDFWIITTVDRDAMRNNSLAVKDFSKLIYRSHNRGLFKICYEDYTGKNTQTCYGELRYELTRRSITRDWGADYERYIHIFRLVFIALIIAMVLQLLAVMAGIIVISRDSRKIMACGIAVVSFAVLFLIGAIAAFHVVDNYERTILQQEEFPAYWPDNGYRLLSENYTRVFGWSYALFWVGTVLTVLTTLLYIAIYVQISRHKDKYPHSKEPVYANSRASKTYSTHLSNYNDDRDTEANSFYSGYNREPRNLAYDMAEYDVPPPDELDCIQEDMFGNTHL